MAMTKRERTLAIGVGLVVGLFGVQYVFQSITGRLQAKQALVDAARSENDDKTRVITAGQIAARKIDQLKSKSLPTHKETLVAQYRNWLSKVAQQVGMQDISITPPDRAYKATNAYAAYNFTLRGQCRIDQWLELMAAFYDTDYLHSITGLKVQMTKELNVINVTLEAQAYALRGAGVVHEASGESSGRLSMSVEEYKQVILDRNPFSAPNQPPRLAGKREYELHRGEAWNTDLAAEDAEAHQVEFELVSTEVPEGLKLDGKSFSWQPEKNGNYEIVVKATDNGWPSKSTEEKLTLKVIDPPPPEVPAAEPPKFDVASQAYVSALLSGRAGPEAWIRSRTEGKTLQLAEGSDFEIGSIKAKVVSINLNEDFIELETDGKNWTIGMDTSLADAFKRSQVD